ncbi:MAG: hypothetical protein K0B37_14035 [Bacteroidales bacterium]|nr:hypothetical protein [Bacteroidales bacterium]
MSKNLFLLALLFVQCGNLAVNDSSKCDVINEKTAKLVYDYYFNNDLLLLDSALIYIDEGLKKCNKYEKLFSLRKLGVLSLKQNYNDALQFIESFDENMFGELPYFKNFLNNRFIAMQAHFVGDSVTRNSYLNEIVAEIDLFLSMNDKEIKALLKLSDVNEILENPLTTSLMQYYYYKALLEGAENVKVKLNLLYRNQMISEEFKDILISIFDEDFLVFVGF